MDTFVFLKHLSQWAMPPASLLVGLVLGWGLARVGWRRLGRVVVGLAIAETMLLSFPPVGDWLMQLLEDEARTAARSAPACCYDAILVLGGGLSPAMPPHRADPDLTDAADRMWYAAQLYRRGVAPRVIVSGGNLQMLRGGAAANTEAEGMRRFLIDLGVPAEAIVTEGASINTIENMAFVRPLVNGGSAALVTSGYHMPRALKLARQAGLKVAAFPTDWRALPAARPSWENWIPSVAGLGMSGVALRELIALAIDRRGAGSAP